jgi:hypothetical protein
MKKALAAQWLIFQCLLASASCPSAPTASRFTINGHQVTDQQTGLVWARCSLGQVLIGDACTGTVSTWTHSMALSQAQSAIGFWRLPNRRELLSLTDRGCHAPALDATAFPNTPNMAYWSTTPYSGDTNRAWSVHFLDGGTTFNGTQRGELLAVRLIKQ